MPSDFTPEQEAALAAYCRVATTEARWRELPSAWRATGLTDEDFKPMLFMRFAAHLCDRLTAAEAKIAELQSTADGIVKIRELHATPGSIETRMETDPALREFIACAFVKMLGDAPNYAEIQFTTGTPTQSLTLTVQRRDGNTPHQLRKDAERDTAFLLEIVGDHVDPKHLTSEDAETLNRIRQRTQEPRT